MHNFTEIFDLYESNLAIKNPLRSAIENTAFHLKYQYSIFNMYIKLFSLPYIYIYIIYFYLVRSLLSSPSFKSF